MTGPSGDKHEFAKIFPGRIIGRVREIPWSGVEPQ